MKTIYINGNIITMEEEYPKAEAIMIENGKIIDIGNNKDLLHQKEPEDIIIDLHNKTMMPGFIDGHSHFVGFANSLSQCDLSNAKDFQDIIIRMKKFIKDRNIDQGEVVVGCNYDHNYLLERTHPNKYILDQISTKHQIIIIHASSHMGVCNSYMLNIHNINEKTIDPEGGHFGRLSNNEPDGYMEENAFINFQSLAVKVKPEKLFQLIVRAQDIYASYGITTIQDGMVNDELFSLLQYASQQNLFKQDIIAYIDINHCRSTLLHHKQYTNQYINHLKIGGYKLFLDGSPQGGTAWMSEPYTNEKNGYPILTDEKLNELITVALEDHQQLLAHCNGDEAANQYITQFEQVKKIHSNTKRPVMIHAQLVRYDQLERMLSLSMIPSFFIAHTYYWGDIHLANFGLTRGSHISPANYASRLGMPYTFHQDTPVLMPDMFKTVWCAVNRQTKNGVDIGKDERICVQDALKAITINGAYQYFEEETKGSLKIGKVADLVILDKNPLTINPTQIDQIQVLETIKDGKTIYKRSS